ncbi:MAG: hypothetical protein GY705_12670 [Bacteroidetes bacterium]|nr:hypothetical protein [Bacteroidota bacterium]
MSTKNKVKNEIIELWSKYEKKTPFGKLYFPDISEFLIEVQKECYEEVDQHLQPWSQILDEWIYWIGALALLLEKNAKKCTNGSTIFKIIGSSVAYANSLRILIRSGYDTPARSLARVLDEHLCASLIFIHYPALAVEFGNCETEDESNHFWYKHLRSKKVTHHLNSIEQELATIKGVTADYSEDFRGWRTRAIRNFSRAIHPSNIGAATSTYTNSLSEEGQYKLAIFGQASSASWRTIDFICKSMFYFAVYGTYLLFNDTPRRPAFLKLNSADKEQVFVVIGQDVLTEVMIKYLREQEDNKTLNTDSGNSPAEG